MRLVRALNMLMEMKFVAEDTEIHIVVNKGKSIKKGYLVRMWYNGQRSEADFWETRNIS